jgi:hypothetical protein
VKTTNSEEKPKVEMIKFWDRDLLLTAARGVLTRLGIFIAFLLLPVSSFGGQRQCHIGILGHVHNIYSQTFFLDCNKKKLIHSILLNIALIIYYINIYHLFSIPVLFHSS